MTFEVRAMIHFLWIEGGSNQAIAARIHARCGEDSISLRSIQYWTHCFANGDDRLEDAPRPGRPRSTENFDAIRQLLEDNPFISQKKIVVRDSGRSPHYSEANCGRRPAAREGQL
jgi:hypothetical protein